MNKPTEMNHVIFTGGAYYLIPELPKPITGDFAIISGVRWVKSKKAFGTRWQMFACPKHYQVLTPAEVANIGK